MSVCVGRCVRPKDIEHQKRQYRDMETACAFTSCMVRTGCFLLPSEDILEIEDILASPILQQTCRGLLDSQVLGLGCRVRIQDGLRIQL